MILAKDTPMTPSSSLLQSSRKKVLAALFTALTTLATLPLQANEQTTTEAQIKAVESDIEQIKQLLETINAERSNAAQLLHENEQNIHQLNREISALETRLKEGQSDIKKLQSRQQQLTASNEQLKAQVALSLQSLYKSPGDSRLKLLLNQSDPAQVSRQWVYMDYFQQAQFEAIGKFEQTVTELKTLQSQQQQLIARLDQQKVAINLKKKTLVEQQQERKKLLGTLSRRYQTGGKELKQLEKQRQQLDEILADIHKRALSSQSTSTLSFKTRKGNLPWPVTGNVLFKFNEPNPQTRMRWQGIFIAAQTGTTVNAVNDGQVIFADWLGNYGLLAIVDHGNSFLTLYAHNDAILKQEGDTVLAGEPLARSGNTGGQQTEGVYFEVRHNGKPQNPSLWLSR